ncbi:MAG: undecaprenyl-diphosphate phosphatase [Bdellovibrionaceae bacterium]|nr:undecaprenyl-diphosphate phosphatase [Pseudobdellovibrionaceae bacterium]MDW8189641.1 undecaprenyl-diphosphate phosphatase [Pseudobdellovibrionaceae bacterium]
MSFIQVLLLSLVEGVTEFLPISSTGHLILFSAALGLHEDLFTQNFNIIIQFGAILAVVVLYWKQFYPVRWWFYKKIFISFVPTAVIGFIFKKQIESLLDEIWVVSLSLLIGGIFLIWLDKRSQNQSHETISRLSVGKALLIGMIQSLAMVPGISRSGAAIIGGLLLGLNRKEATEYSFFLGVPTLMAAGLFKAYKVLPTISSEQMGTLAAGFVLSFIFAVGSIKFLLHILSRYGLYHFGWYRIVLGLILLLGIGLGFIPTN